MTLLLLCFVLVSTMAQVIKGGGELVVRVEAVENKFANPYTMLAAMAMLGVGYAVGRLWNARCYWKKEERYKMKIELLKETVADLEKQREERFRWYVIWHTEAQKKTTFHTKPNCPGLNARDKTKEPTQRFMCGHCKNRVQSLPA